MNCSCLIGLALVGTGFYQEPHVSLAVYKLNETGKLLTFKRDSSGIIIFYYIPTAQCMK